MTATVGACLKKIALILLSDKNKLKKILSAIIILLIVICTPFIALVAIFCGGINFDQELLQRNIKVAMVEQYQEELQLIDDTMTEIETKLDEKGLLEYKKQAEVMYIFNLIDISSETDFIENYVSCFKESQTDEEFVNEVNDKFGLSVDYETFENVISSINNS